MWQLARFNPEKPARHPTVIQHLKEVTTMVVESTNDTRVLEIRSKGKHFMKTMLKVAMMVVIALVSFLGVVLAYLAYPGTPDRSKFMAFDGFIKLPRGRLLTVLDYLTLS